MLFKCCLIRWLTKCALIICVALRISLRRHALAHRFLHAAAAAVKQKLDTNTEEGKKMRSSHTWLPPYPSFPNSAPLRGSCRRWRKLCSLGHHPGSGHGSGWALSPSSRAQSWLFIGCQEVGSPVLRLSQKGLGGAGRNRENVLLPWTLPPHPWGAGRR